MLEKAPLLCWGLSPAHGGSGSLLMCSIQISKVDLHNVISQVPWLGSSTTSSSGRARAKQTSLMK